MDNFDLGDLLSELKAEEKIEVQEKEWYDCTMNQINMEKDDRKRAKYSFLYRKFFTETILPLYNNAVKNNPNFAFDGKATEMTPKRMLIQVAKYCNNIGEILASLQEVNQEVTQEQIDEESEEIVNKK